MAERVGDPRDPRDWVPWPGWAPTTALPGVPDLAPDLTRPLTAADLDGVWRLDFHHPRGIVPLAQRLLDHLVAGSQLAAAQLGQGAGFTARLLGTHVYYGAARPGAGSGPAASGWSASDDDRFDNDRVDNDRFDDDRFGDERAVRAYAASFPQQWAADSGRLDTALRRLERLEQAELERAGCEAISSYLDQALAVHQDAWRVHFGTMYRLLAVHAHLLNRLREFGLDEVAVAGLLQGEDNAVLDADAELRELVGLARELGLTALFEAHAQADPAALLQRLRQGEPGGPQSLWCKAFGDFLDRHGHRGEAGAELVTAPWNEDPAPALALIHRQLLEPVVVHHRAGPRDASDRVRAGLPASARAGFDEILALARQANFAWWNEEHNLVIDLRAHLPVRRAALAAAGALRLPRPDDALYLHLAELQELLAGRGGWAEVAAVADERRAYVAHWRERRAQLPVDLGSGPDSADPVLREILGSGYPARGAGAATLRGLGVSPGVARGRARVLATLGELADVGPGEVLVCEATSPAWTPVFDRIAGCVCDQGGMLTHAAIIAREYGVPAVCGVPGASSTIRTGDLVEVDGTAGEVRVLQVAETVAAPVVETVAAPAAATAATPAAPPGAAL
jgi:phosphohistidine swiveling domain-containing protein